MRLARPTGSSLRAFEQQPVAGCRATTSYLLWLVLLLASRRRELHASLCIPLPCSIARVFRNRTRSNLFLSKLPSISYPVSFLSLSLSLFRSSFFFSLLLCRTKIVTSTRPTVSSKRSNSVKVRPRNFGGSRTRSKVSNGSRKLLIDDRSLHRHGEWVTSTRLVIHCRIEGVFQQRRNHVRLRP